MDYSDNQLAQDLNKFWDTEAIGLIDHKQQLLGTPTPDHYLIVIPFVLVG